MIREGPIRLLIIDGSPKFRTRLRSALVPFHDIAVLPTAANTSEARECVIRDHPDIIILDLELHRGDSLMFLKKLRDHYPVPTFVSAQTEGHTDAMQAIEMGALDVFAKANDASPKEFEHFAEAVARKTREAFSHARPVPPVKVGKPVSPISWRGVNLEPARHIVAIGASTGGTEAIRALLSSVPADFPPVVITQHMPAGFTRNFAERLDHYCPLRVSEAVDGDRLTPGCAVVARGDTHIELRKSDTGWRVIYTHQTPVNNHCPSVDVMFDSVARYAGKAAIGILLTGMGGDGAKGLLKIRENGGKTIGQNQESCVVYGMPKVAAQLGAVMEAGAPADIPAIVLRMLQHKCVAR